MLIHNKDDIEFVTEFPCLLGHPVFAQILIYEIRKLNEKSINNINKASGVVGIFQILNPVKAKDWSYPA